MKIVFLADDFPPMSFGGAGMSTCELAVEMRERGHEVSVITTCRSRDEAGRSEHRGLAVYRVHTAYRDRWRFYTSIYNPQVVGKVRDLLRQIRPDVVHANNIHEHLSYYCLKLAKQNAKAVVITFRDTMAVTFGKLETKHYLNSLDPRISWLTGLRQARKRWNPLRNAAIRHYLRYADKRVAISRALRDALEANGVHEVDVIYNGIRPDDWSPLPELAERFREAHGLRGRKVLLFSGRVSAAKGAGKAIEALALLVRDVPDALLLVAGPLDTLGEALREAASDLGISDNVRFTGWLDPEGMRAAYAVADVVLMPSLYLDAFGRVNIEGMAAGKPVIGTRFGGTPEVIRDGETGFIVDPRYPREIADCARELLSHEQEARLFGETGRERVAKHFNVAQKAEEYIRAYEQRMNGSIRVDFARLSPELQAMSLPGSVYEAGAFMDELAALRLSDGTRLSKKISYRGFEMWWLHYNSIFIYFALPFAQYRNLLAHLATFRSVRLVNPPFPALFRSYLESFGCKVSISRRRSRILEALPFGVFLQMLLTIISVPVLAILRPQTLIFTSDKFAKGKDYDFRLSLVYEELRKRGVFFTEFIRSLEPWHVVLRHSFYRARPVVYSEAVAFVGRLLNMLFRGERSVRGRIEPLLPSESPEVRFKARVATAYLYGVAGDIWATKIMSGILNMSSIRAGIFISSTERNLHTLMAAKLSGIRTFGIMHGVSTRYGTPCDFLNGFDGERTFSNDLYGVWSEWWKEYFLQRSDAYRPEQLIVSGPMRPILREEERSHGSGLPRVLFVAEQTVAPEETFPYLEELLRSQKIELTLKFRPYRDGFEEWLKECRPELFAVSGVRIVRGTMEDAIRNCDIAVGCHSTGVLEALLQLKVPVFLHSRKWGDYYEMAKQVETKELFAKDPAELMEKIARAGSISEDLLAKLRERYFGDPRQNGSLWMVDAVEKHLRGPVSHI